MTTPPPLPSPAVLLEVASRVDVDGSVETATAVELGLSGVRFWMAVNRLLDDPPADVALTWGPQINRLRRLRAGRQRQRRAS